MSWWAGADGIIDGLAEALRGAASVVDPSVALVVADESEDYRPEMDWAATALREAGLPARQVHPRDLRLHGEALQMRNCDGWESVDLVYRFLELHDLPNIPKIDLVIYAMKHRLATVTAPFKSYLEEKLLFYLFHHPELDTFWRGALGKDTQARLARMLPPTWLLDPQPIPPTAAIDPPLLAGKRRIRHWSDLRGLSQRERRLVLKPSGFSELAWGSRGVTIGHDVNQTAWDAAVDHALASFDSTPYIPAAVPSEPARSSELLRRRRRRGPSADRAGAHIAVLHGGGRQGPAERGSGHGGAGREQGHPRDLRVGHDARDGERPGGDLAPSV